MKSEDLATLQQSDPEHWWAILLDPSDEQHLATVVGEGDPAGEKDSFAELRKHDKGGAGWRSVQFVKAKHILQAGREEIELILLNNLGGFSTREELDDANDAMWDRMFWTPD